MSGGTQEQQKTFKTQDMTVTLPTCQGLYYGFILHPLKKL